MMQSLQHPEIGILLGSKSDIPIVKKLEEVFSFFSVRWEVSVASAHRTPEDVAAYGRNASMRGIRVLIAAAGLSAALPGVLAAHTPLPVIGIPLNAGSLGGMDALLAVAQMPPGVPVASMGIDGARNAALFAVRILALSRGDLPGLLETWMEREAKGVRSSRTALEDLPVPPEDAFSS